ncbi:cold-shock protein [Bradyrhizobium sp. C-145]|nr:cold-shock protein [Bradyrhizobium sp. C-145]
MGTVNWFNATKGYGFIQPEDGEADVFVHIGAVEKVGYTSFAEGGRVSYDMKPIVQAKSVRRTCGLVDDVAWRALPSPSAL